MNHNIRRFFIALMVLALASMACATLSGGNPPAVPDTAALEATAAQVATQAAQAVTQALQITPEPLATTVPSEPTATGGGETSPSGGAGADSISLDDPKLYAQPAGVNTYQMNLTYTFSGQASDGTALTGSITGDGAYSVDPYQFTFNFQTSSSTIPLGSMELVQIDNTLYMSSAELGCFSLPVGSTGAENPYEELISTGGLFTGVAQRIQPDETVNDIPAYVYEITSANLKTSDATAKEITELTSGRLYLAQDGGYVVRIIMDGRGHNTLGDQPDLIGEVHYEINYFGQNQPVDIAPPEGCTQGDSGGGVTPTGTFPVPEGATDLISITGITTFSSSQTVEELSTFYKTEMVAAGWTMGDELNITGLVTLTFTKDGKTATVTITADPSTGKTQVAIFEG